MEFLSLLQKKEILLFDGALGTELMLRGLKPRDVPDKWNLDRPEVIKEVFEQYYNAGSDIVQTATFRANGVALEKYGIENLIEDINKSSGEILRSVCPPDKCVIGDIGPSGEFLEPVGKASINDLKKGFQKQAKALAPFVDAWHLETFSDIREMKAAILAVQIESNKPIIASMTYQRTPKGYFTIMGNTLIDCVSELLNSGVAIIGSNCTLSSNDFFDLMKTMRAVAPKIPLSIKPNAGNPELENGKSIYKQPPEDFAKDIKKILEHDGQIVGGCCGTGPTHIKLLRKIIDELRGG
ncbi:MAG: homocysteine S-methyltransferase family protein [Candidatus Heimdallarchaeota archaeon]|nr:MAG: homocysteine S-methyltransferase family protein [Candidatus Heimdallarchaeota archaeon]